MLVLTWQYRLILRVYIPVLLAIWHWDAEIDQISGEVISGELLNPACVGL